MNMNLRGKFNGMNWWLKAIVVWIGITLVWNHLPYRYDPEGAADYVAAHALPKSKTMCAWYVMRAMQSGGGCPIGILPAYAYAKTLPQMGFEEVANEGTKDYEPKKGDISVLPQNDRSAFGHIAIYNGKQWVSDFEQKKGIYPGTAYSKAAKYQIFRTSKGWHWKHVWTHPGDWWGWIKSVVGWITGH